MTPVGKRLISPTILFFLLFVLVLSPAYAEEERVENYNDKEYLDLALLISSDIGITYPSGAHQIEYVKAELSFYPQDDERQEVSRFDMFSTPEAHTKKKQEEIHYTWTNHLNDDLNYGLSAEIRVQNDVTAIVDTISFPLQKYDETTMEYTQATEYIEITQAIEHRAQEIIAGEDDYYQAIFKLAEWTQENINYNLSTLTAEVVQPSSWVLENKEGVCDEITNLFISLLRSVGIPARFVSGMVYSNLDYSWGPHGWAEVYFPEIGWVPFDITFGEYGWLDPSHIKLKDNIDSGNPTARYSWKSNGAEIDIEQLEIETELLSTGPQRKPSVELEVIPMKKSAQFGSYVPVEVKVTNLLDHYVAPKIVITKSPELTKHNVQWVLLPPRQEKSLYWIVHIPEADEDFVYTTTIEARGSFGEEARETMKYGTDFTYYSHTFAQEIVDSYEERTEKEQLKDISLGCSTDKELYYREDIALIDCDVQNTGAQALSGTICFQESCQDIQLKGKEGTTIQHELTVQDSVRLPIIIEDERSVSYMHLNVDVIPIPEVILENLHPQTVRYDEDIRITFDLSSNTIVNELLIDFGFDTLEYATFESGAIRTVTFSTTGRQLLNDLTYTMSYRDANNKFYTKKGALYVDVVDVPWYGHFIHWIENIMH